MKRLLSIVLMNAWGGLRKKAILPTMGMVGVSVMALLVASTVTAGASPHTNIPVVSKVASAVRATITNPISSFLDDTSNDKPAPPKKPKSQPSISNNTSQQSVPPTSVSSSTAGTGGTSASQSTSSTTQSSTQSTANSVSLATLQCVPNQSANTYAFNIPSAQLNLTTPTAVDGTLTYEWETMIDSGQNAGQVTPGTILSQTFKAGVSKIVLTGPGQSQGLYNAQSTNYDYSFRLRITGPVNVSSSWVSVPQSSDGLCPQVTAHQ